MSDFTHFGEFGATLPNQTFAARLLYGILKEINQIMRNKLVAIEKAYRSTGTTVNLAHFDAF